MPYDTYWDLSDHDRAKIAPEDLTKYIDIELMEKGILRPAPLELEPEESPEVPLRFYYRIQYAGYWSDNKLELLFTNQEDARDFIDTWIVDKSILVVSYDGRNLAGPIVGPTITSEELPLKDDVLKRKAEIDSYEGAKKRNDKKRTDYERDLKLVASTASIIEEDWHRCMALEDTYQKIRNTYNTYLKMTKDDEVIALRFLRKVYEDSLIAMALALNQDTFEPLPDNDEPAPVTSPDDDNMIMF